jgi:hypothetical protein
MQLININSILCNKANNTLNNIQVTNLEKELEILNSGFWQSKDHHSPIFLVDKMVMDIIYPPKKKSGILDSLDFLLSDEIADKPYNENELYTILLGVHILNFNISNYNLPAKISDELAFLLNKGKNPITEVIFVCPERILNASQKTSQKPQAFEIIFKVVCLHEIAHGYMAQVYHSDKIKNNWYSKWWGKLIEESFANLISWHLLRVLNNNNKKIAEDFMNSQPVEYRSYNFWRDSIKMYPEVSMIISSWLNGIRPFESNWFYEFEPVFKNTNLKLVDYNNLKSEAFTLNFENNRKSSDLLSLFENKNEKVWESIALAIIRKMILFKRQVMIYEVEGVSSKHNYSVLLDKANRYFYWNDKYFKNLEIGDLVFVVNYDINETFFCFLDNKVAIKSVNNSNTTSFTDNETNLTYNIQGTYNNFVRLKVLFYQTDIPTSEWKRFGAGESAYIYGKRINLKSKVNRIKNIEYLTESFDNDKIQNILNICLDNFS